MSTIVNWGHIVLFDEIFVSDYLAYYETFIASDIVEISIEFLGMLTPLVTQFQKKNIMELHGFLRDRAIMVPQIMGLFSYSINMKMDSK